MKRELTCIICPLGCNLTVEEKNGEFFVSGNTCKRGEAYAVSECTAPTRTVTSTVFCPNGKMLPVKTDKPIPKDKIFECMKIINNCTPVLPISAGDVIIKDVFGCNIVAADNA